MAPLRFHVTQQKEDPGLTNPLRDFVQFFYATLKVVAISTMKPRDVAIADLGAARDALVANRNEGLKLLNDLFRAGQTPDPAPDGRLLGELVDLDLAPGLTELLTRLTSRWLPWKGKTFDRAQARGDNVFTRDSLRIARIFNPLYNGFVGDGPETYRAFTFRTYVAPGREDPDRLVMKIDYDLAENPPSTVRRVLDELVQIGEGTFLGKAHVKWWWGHWRRVAFFALFDPA